MNRVILLLAAHMFAAQAFGECVARAYRLGTEAPLFNLQSCSLAGEVIDTSRIDAPFPQPTEDDKAVFVIPANQASSTTIRNNGEY